MVDVDAVPWTAKMVTGGAAVAVLGLAAASLRNKLGVSRTAEDVDPSVKNMVVDVAAISDRHRRHVRVLSKYDPSVHDAMQRLSFARHYDAKNYDAILRNLAHIVKVAAQFRVGTVPSGERGSKVSLVHSLRMQVRGQLIELQKNLRGSASIRKTCRAAAADIMHALIGHARTVIMRTTSGNSGNL